MNASARTTAAFRREKQIFTIVLFIHKSTFVVMFFALRNFFVRLALNNSPEANFIHPTYKYSNRKCCSCHRRILVTCMVLIIPNGVQRLQSCMRIYHVQSTQDCVHPDIGNDFSENWILLWKLWSVFLFMLMHIV